MNTRMELDKCTDAVIGSEVSMGRPVLAVSFSIAIATLLAVTVLYVGWKTYRDERGFCPKQDITRDFLEALSKDITQHYSENHSLPESLAELPRPSRHSGTRPRVDEWQEPLHYVVKSDREFVLSSFGRDRKFGGEGLDCDLYSDGRERQLRQVTWRQFLVNFNGSELNGKPLFISAAITWAATFIAILSATRKKRLVS